MSDQRLYTVSAPIVAIASVQVMATSTREAREIGYEVLLDGDTNASIHVHYDFDIDREELHAERTEDPARALATHVATEHFDLAASTVSDRLSATHEQWQAMHDGLHANTPCTHTHEEETA